MKNLKHLFIILFLLLLVTSSQLLAQELPKKTFPVGYDIYNFDIRMDTYLIKPQETHTKFQIDLSYLADAKTQGKLPVIYVTDGQWRRMDHKYIHYLTYKKIIPPVIVAGIGYPEEYDAGQVRTMDLIYQPDLFLQALKQEIIPLVEQKIAADPQKRYLFGASAGGHFAAYAFLTSALNSDPVFAGYIGSSPYLPGSRVIQLAKELASRKRNQNSKVFLAYGQKEGYQDYHLPNDELFEILESKKLQGLQFYHYVYPGSDHFTNTRLTLIDGLRLFLGNEKTRGIGAVDLKYKSYHYDFRTATQFYDWNTNIFAANSHVTDPKSAPDLAHTRATSGSFKTTADFTKYSSLFFETSSVYFENLADRVVEISIFIPESLAKLKYGLRFKIYSTFSFTWIADFSESFTLAKSGWNTFRYKWRGKQISGSLNCIRGFGVVIDKPEAAPAWKGDIYFDNIKW